MLETRDSIALKTKLQLDSCTVGELKQYCKILGLRGYSKYRKSELVDLIFDSLAIERERLINIESNAQTLAESEKQRKAAIRKEIALKEHPINIDAVNNLYLQTNKKSEKIYTTKDIANILFQLCKNQFVEITVAKNCTQKLVATLPDTKLNELEQLKVLEAWKDNVRAINAARKIAELKANESYAKNAVKTLDTHKIIEWASLNINSENLYIKGLALALTSGRRMTEIFNSEFSLGNIGIVMDGIAKKSTEGLSCEFICLIDCKTWLKAHQSLELKQADKKKLRSLSKLFSRHFPASLKDLDIEKFKDCRDFYSGVLHRTFDQISEVPIVCVKKNMGHDSESATVNYMKFKCDAIEDLSKFKMYLEEKIGC